MKGKLPGSGAAFALFVTTLFLNVIVNLLLFGISEDLGVLLGEPLAILLPTLLVVRALDLDARKTLRLQIPSRSDVLLALPLAFSLAVVNDQISNLTSQVFPLSDDIQEGMIRLLRAESVWDWTVKILGIGVGAAVSEEILFRGFIQRGLERGLNRNSAILMTAILFATMHLIPQGIPSYALAGVVLGVVALASGSIVVPILVHFIYNMSAVVLLSLADIESLGRPVWIPAGILVPALLIFGLTLTHFIRKASSIPAPQPRSIGPASALPLDEPAAPLAGLKRVAPERRRLGWLAVGCAVAWGVVVVLGLFSYSVYRTFSKQIHAYWIQSLQQEVIQSLPPSASARAEEIEDQFKALLAANQAGRVRLGQISSLNWTYAEARADGAVSEEEIERLLEEIRSILRASTPIRRL